MITPEKIQKQCDLLADLLKRKNADYGDSFSEAPYLLPTMNNAASAYIRLSDKFKRLRTLLNRQTRPSQSYDVFEPIEDTLRDVAGYCVLLLADVAPPADEEGAREE